MDVTDANERYIVVAWNERERSKNRLPGGETRRDAADRVFCDAPASTVVVSTPGKLYRCRATFFAQK